VERGPEMGLELNPSKCEWTWLNPKCKKAVPHQAGGSPRRTPSEAGAPRQDRDAVRRSDDAEAHPQQVHHGLGVLESFETLQYWLQACLQVALDELGGIRPQHSTPQSSEHTWR